MEKIESKDNKVGGGISREVFVNGELKGSIYIRNKDYTGPDEFMRNWDIKNKYQVHTIDRPYKARYFKTYNGAVKFIVRNGRKFMSLQQAVNNLYNQ